jgi:hypothetical protein
MQGHILPPEFIAVRPFVGLISWLFEIFVVEFFNHRILNPLI